MGEEPAYTAEQVRQSLARALTELRAIAEGQAEIVPGNDLARESKHKAIGYLRALDDIARTLGLKTRTEYTA